MNQELNCRFMRTGEYAQVLRIWQACFGDPERYVRFFWKHCFPMGRGLVHEENGRAVSMLFLLPGALRRQQNLLPAEYVYAVATLPEYRGRGFAGQLLRYAEGIAKQEGKSALCLLPATQELSNFYARMGFVTAFMKQDFDADYAGPQGSALSQPLPLQTFRAARRETWGAQGYFEWPAHMLEYMFREHIFTGGTVYGEGENAAFLNAEGRVKERFVNRPGSTPGGMLLPLDSKASLFLQNTRGEAYLGFPLD